MQTLYRISINHEGQYAVDIFRPVRRSHIQWKSYYRLSISSIVRLRRAFLKYPKRFYVTKGWSPSRWQAYKDWRAGRVVERIDRAERGYLVSLETKSTDIQP